MKKINSIRDIMLQQIRALYDADRTIYEALPALRERAKSEELRDFLEEEIEEKLRQQHRMEIVFTILKEDTEGSKNDVVRCMAQSQKRLAGQCSADNLSDTMLIITGRAINTHQINAYQTAVEYATKVGYPDISRLLKRALQDERNMERKLEELADHYIQTPVSVKV